MISKINILAISGSTRRTSSNLNLIKAIAGLTSDIFTITIFEDLAQLPHFNPDLDTEIPPPQIIAFREQLKAADGILICTPEYAVGVPGSLKNAIDWTVSSMEFSQKPVALITGSSSGERAHKSLLGTLLIIESKITAKTELLISNIKTKVTVNGEIIDNGTLEGIHKLIDSLTEIIMNKDVTMLSAPLLRHEGIDSGSNR